MKADIRYRPIIMTINVESLLSNKKVLEHFINDRDFHVIVVVESNVTETKVDVMKLENYSIANKICREDNLAKGGEGSGVSPVFGPVFGPVSGPVFAGPVFAGPVFGPVFMFMIRPRIRRTVIRSLR